VPSLKSCVFNSRLFQAFFAREIDALAGQWEESFKRQVLGEIMEQREQRKADAVVSSAIVDGRKAFEESRKRFSKTYSEEKPA
jgi:hypothetical protein